MLVGFHVEGHDHIIVQALLAKLLGIEEATIEVDRIKMGMGWHQVLEVMPKALRRFYGKCCAIAVVGIDNDGNEDLAATGKPEDPKHPRHWLHSVPLATCRHCQIEDIIGQTRPHLTWVSSKPGSTWPIVVCVPVEMIESWLLVAQAAVVGGGGSPHAERERRLDQKQRVYGRPEATKEDVESVAVPLLRSLTPVQIAKMRQHSSSFDAFATAVVGINSTALQTACWS